QGPGEKGEPVDGDGEKGEGQGGAGEDEGHHIMEVEVELSELAEMLGQELELPRIEPRGDRALMADGGRYTGVRKAGLQSLPRFRGTFKRALQPTIAAGEWDPMRPKVVPIKDDERFRAKKSCPQPD